MGKGSTPFCELEGRCRPYWSRGGRGGECPCRSLLRGAGGRFAVVSGRAEDGVGMDVVGDGGPGGLPLTLWGKFSARLGLAYPLLFHLLDAAVVAGELWDRMLSPAQ
ncbi:HD domain-containing protein [Streptomyces cyaneofuscatus]|uniref:HD domain-containing protein n=2 Tax=Streptomyces TaxID=1883 RepID=UPI003CF0727A